MTTVQTSGTVLTDEAVLEQTKALSLSEVKALNFWGKHISDISVVSRLPNVEVLSLSMNNISSLAPLASCKRLRELFLRKNKIADACELTHLRGLRDLRVLWISENPFEHTVNNYRLVTINTLPQLAKLDNQDVTESERLKAGALGPNTIARRTSQKDAPRALPAAPESQGAAYSDVYTHTPGSRKASTDSTSAATQLGLSEGSAAMSQTGSRPRRRERARRSIATPTTGDDSTEDTNAKSRSRPSSSSRPVSLSQSNSTKEMPEDASQLQTELVRCQTAAFSAVLALIPSLNTNQLTQLRDAVELQLSRR